MGCDIHIYAERKLENGTWACVQTFPYHSAKAFRFWGEEAKNLDFNTYYRVTARNYAFFGALAGVRGYPGPEPKGMPDDVSPLVAEACEDWDGDGHSHSWLSADKFIPIFMQHCMSPEEVSALESKKREVGWSVDIPSEVLQNYVGVDRYDHKLQDYRFVFWFDN